jgi:hypothetical protein
LNPGRRGGKPATNRLSYGAAFIDDLVVINPTEVANRIIHLIREQAVVGTKEAGINSETIIQFVIPPIKVVGHASVTRHFCHSVQPPRSCLADFRVPF